MGSKKEAKSGFKKFSELLLPEVVDPRSKVDLIENIELISRVRRNTAARSYRMTAMGLKQTINIFQVVCPVVPNTM